MTRIIAFVNRKGGVAKTTSAVNVAARLAQHIQPQKKRVLLIDLDPQGNVAKALGVDPAGRCISQLLVGEGEFKDVVLSADRSHAGGPSRPNLFFVPATDELVTATAELMARDVAVSMTGRGKQSRITIKNILSQRFTTDTLKWFEFVVVDCPPTLGLLDTATYDFVQEIIVPVKMAFLDTSGAAQHLEDVLAAKESGLRARLSLVLPTFYRSNEILARQVLEELKALHGRLVAKPIPQSVVVEQSQASSGLTLFEYKAEAPVAQAYDDLARRVMSGR